MLRKKLKDMNNEEKSITDKITFEIMNELKSTYAGAAERGQKCLFLLNGGGVVTILAYMHTTGANSSRISCSVNPRSRPSCKVEAIVRLPTG